MNYNSSVKNESIQAINTRQIAIAVLFIVIASAIIALLIIRHKNHKLEIYSAESSTLNKSLVVKPKFASAVAGYAPVSMSFNLPATGR